MGRRIKVADVNTVFVDCYYTVLKDQVVLTCKLPLDSWGLEDIVKVSDMLVDYFVDFLEKLNLDTEAIRDVVLIPSENKLCMLTLANFDKQDRLIRLFDDVGIVKKEF